METTARTVDEAVDLALDQLGVDEQEAEWEVLEEPRPGLFGRVRGQARIRARIQPKAQPSKGDKRDRRRGGAKGDGGGTRRSERGAEAPAAEAPAVADVATEPAASEPAATEPTEAEPRSGAGTSNRERKVAHESDASVEEVAEQVQSFLDGLVRAFGETAPVVIDRSDDEVVGRVDAKVGLMIGPKGQTLEAIQELTRVTAQRSAPSEVRIKVDIGSYRAQRQAALERFARQVAEKVRDSGKPVALEPMPAADRKIVHDALGEEPGVVTHSDGTEPRRRVVVAPGDGA